MIELAPTSIGNIRRWREPPFFDFVEEAIASGQAYAWNDEGYILVAGAQSLLPGFVVEIGCPRRPWIDTSALIDAICEISCGAMWFDSCDHDAFDLVRRSGRAASASALLFANGRSVLPPKHGGRLEIRLCRDGETSAAIDLVCSPASDIGGVTESEAERMISRGEVWGGFLGEKLMAVAIVRPQGEVWSSIGLVVTSQEGRAAKVGVRFTNALMRHFTRDGRSLCAGVGVGNAFAYRSALRLGFEPVRQSWTALLAEAIDTGPRL